MVFETLNSVSWFGFADLAGRVTVEYEQECIEAVSGKRWQLHRPLGRSVTTTTSIIPMAY